VELIVEQGEHDAEEKHHRTLRRGEFSHGCTFTMEGLSNSARRDGEKKPPRIARCVHTTSWSEAFLANGARRRRLQPHTTQ
jgi:hypothetical protein